MIRLMGLHPERDIKIVYTGLRPGEKLFEELSLQEEDVTKTNNSKFISVPQSKRILTILPINLGNCGMP